MISELNSKKMPTIAQKLCNEIVEPILAPSCNEIANAIPSRKSFKSVAGNSNIRFAKPTRSVVVEKKKEINHIEPSSKTVINKLKSRETILKKKLIETGVNTLISGPLKCDNNCVTNVRKREYNCNCKYGPKRKNIKTITKQVQTILKNCSHSDKACARCIDTNNCGTQIIENHSGRFIIPVSNTLLLKKSNDFQPQFSYRDSPQVTNRISNQTTNRITKTMCQNFKRWALSNYPSRGPDF